MSSITIVMYHYVRDLKRSDFPRIKALPTRAFHGQLDYVQRYYEVVSLDQCLAALRRGRELPPRAALLTFDDGYRDHYDAVFPALRRRRLSAAFFPPACAIEERTVLDVNKIQFVLASTSQVV